MYDYYCELQNISLKRNVCFVLYRCRDDKHCDFNDGKDHNLFQKVYATKYDFMY